MSEHGKVEAATNFGNANEGVGSEPDHLEFNTLNVMEGDVHEPMPKGHMLLSVAARRINGAFPQSTSRVRHLLVEQKLSAYLDPNTEGDLIKISHSVWKDRSPFALRMMHYGSATIIVNGGKTSGRILVPEAEVTGLLTELHATRDGAKVADFPTPVEALGSEKVTPSTSSNGCTAAAGKSLSSSRVGTGKHVVISALKTEFPGGVGETPNADVYARLKPYLEMHKRISQLVIVRAVREDRKDRSPPA